MDMSAWIILLIVLGLFVLASFYTPMGEFFTRNFDAIFLRLRGQTSMEKITMAASFMYIYLEKAPRAEEGNFNQEDEGHAWPPQPDTVKGANICSTTGNQPQEGEGCPTRFEYFLEDAIGALSIEAGRRDVDEKLSAAHV